MYTSSYKYTSSSMHFASNMLFWCSDALCKGLVNPSTQTSRQALDRQCRNGRARTQGNMPHKTCPNAAGVDSLWLSRSTVGYLCQGYSRACKGTWQCGLWPLAEYPTVHCEVQTLYISLKISPEGKHRHYMYHQRNNGEKQTIRRSGGPVRSAQHEPARETSRNPDPPQPIS